jgi:hypothetical protein
MARRMFAAASSVAFEKQTDEEANQPGRSCADPVDTTVHNDCQMLKNLTGRPVAECPDVLAVRQPLDVGQYVRHGVEMQLPPAGDLARFDGRCHVSSPVEKHCVAEM